MYLKILSVFLFLIGYAKSNEETKLRNSIFGNYNKDIRPTKIYNKTLDVSIGLAVQNIESFDQIQESIELNVWLRKYWRNDNLIWDTKLSNMDTK